MQAVRPFTKLAVRNAAFLSRGYHEGHHHVCTMNEMPVPEGDFFEEHNRRNRTYNTVLAAGLAIFGVTLTIAKQTGLIYLNYNPPNSFE
ncbi:uncharacterized protein LOC131688985 [Topomyia yanbarensis]|uniref:uncharacterized protein LOC131688985 n=1 Tax=Topomyia yanbarensis TaxID=2498891 RepID=UPI00273CB59C|nr:uncharacterized protein LOC131688985 [Topomyia yanbarensis]